MWLSILLIRVWRRGMGHIIGMYSLLPSGAFERGEMVLTVYRER